MASLTLNGIVLRHANYRDNDRILTIFTREQGTVTAAARGCRKCGSALLACSEIFTYGEFVLFEGRGRYTVDACDVRERFYALREDMDRLAAGAYMLSVAEACTPKGQQSEALFDLLYYALSYAAYGKQAPVDVALCFLARCLAILGYTPRLTRCACCGEDLRALPRLGFDPCAGGAVCGACMRPDSIAVSPLSLEAVRRMLLLSNQDMEKVALPERVRTELKAALNAYAEHVLERKLRPAGQLRC